MAEIPVSEDTEMSALRRDAIRRAREMQERARAGAEATPPPPQKPPMPEPPEASPPPPAGPAQRREPERGSSLPGIGGALDFITKDTERSLILILLLILMEEKADNAILFALMYLLI